MHIFIFYVAGVFSDFNLGSEDQPHTHMYTHTMPAQVKMNNSSVCSMSGQMVAVIRRWLMAMGSPSNMQDSRTLPYLFAHVAFRGILCVLGQQIT